MFKYQIKAKEKEVFISFEENKEVQEVLMEAVDQNLIEDADVTNAEVDLYSIDRDTVIDILSDTEDMDYKTFESACNEYHRAAYESYDNFCLADEFKERFYGNGLEYFEGQSEKTIVEGEDIDSIWEGLCDQIGTDLINGDTTALYELLRVIPFRYLKGYLSED